MTTRRLRTCLASEGLKREIDSDGWWARERARGIAAMNERTRAKES
jgi:hypothetical protein